MMNFMGPVVPCESPGCWAIPRVDLQVGGEHMAWVCPFHEWALMRAVNKRTRSLESERGWLDYCRDRGYDHLATTWEGAVRKLKVVSIADHL